jgi:hypothetical protein
MNAGVTSRSAYLMIIEVFSFASVIYAGPLRLCC